MQNAEENKSRTPGHRLTVLNSTGKLGAGVVLLKELHQEGIFFIRGEIGNKSATPCSAVKQSITIFFFLNKNI
jgi:hypothetical protein